MDAGEIAEAFSGHRFGEAYEHLHEDVRWVVPGEQPLVGRAAVVAACESTLEHLAGLARTEFSRFVVVSGQRVAAVDAIGHYVGQDGATSVVSSADIYELDEAGLVTTITSYAVELDEEQPRDG